MTIGVGFPRYQLSVYDNYTGDRLMVLGLNASYNMRYDMRLNDVGKFGLTLPYSDAMYTLFAKDNFIDVERESPDGTMIVENTYLVRDRERFEAQDDERLFIGGLDLNHLLDRRIIDPEDDSAFPNNGGFSTKAGNAGDVIREYIREQAGDMASEGRLMPRLTVGVPSVAGEGVGANLRYENLLDELQKLAKSGGVDFQIVHTGNGDLTCNIGSVGTDRSMDTNPLAPYTILSPVRGNIANPKLIEDATKEINFAYALGDGASANRTVLKLGTIAQFDSAYNRIEKKMDARQTDKGNAFALYTETLKFLIDKQATKAFEFDYLQGSPGFIYRADWYFGDVLTAQYGMFIESLRVTQLEFSLDANGEEIQVTVETYNA